MFGKKKESYISLGLNDTKEDNSTKKDNLSVELEHLNEKEKVFREHAGESDFDSANALDLRNVIKRKGEIKRELGEPLTQEEESILSQDEQMVA